jgi:hypothetical protein
MNISDSDKPKLIVLLCLMAIVIIYGTYRYTSVTKRSAPSKVAPKIDIGNTVAMDDDQQSQNGLYKAEIDGKLRDPFMPMMSASAKKPPTPPSAPSTEQAVRSGTMLPPLAVKGTIPGGVITLPPKLPDAEKPQTLKLVGVIIGDRNLAVIHGDNDTRYMVYEGQTIDGKYHVKYISMSGVWLKFQDQTIVLKLGDENAANK